MSDYTVSHYVGVGRQGEIERAAEKASGVELEALQTECGIIGHNFSGLAIDARRESYIFCIYCLHRNVHA